MRTNLTLSNLGDSNVAVELQDLRQIHLTMDNRSFDHLLDQLFEKPWQYVELASGPVLMVLNRTGLDRSAALDLLNVLVGPAHLGRQCHTYVQQASTIWTRLSTRVRSIKRNEHLASEVK